MVHLLVFTNPPRGWLDWWNDVFVRRDNRASALISPQRISVELNAELRSISDPIEAISRAAAVLGRQLGIGRVGYGDIDETGQFVVVERDWTDGSMGTVAGRHRMEDFGRAIIEELRAGRIMSVDDVLVDERVGRGAAAFAAIKTRAVLAAPLFRAGRFRAMLYLHHHTPRHWSPEDRMIAGETLELTWEAVERARAETLLRASEERFRFLDDLGQRTANLLDAEEILSLTTRLVGEHLQVSNCAYADMDDDEDGFTIRGDWAAPGSMSIVGHYSLADFGRLAVENLSAGRPLIVNDNLRELAPHEAATFQNIGIAATICMPLVKNGRLTALMAIHDRVPHQWTERELSLITAVTERSWAHVERAGAVAELRSNVVQQRAVADQLAALNKNLETVVAERTAELMATEESLRQSQKMEAVGQLTGGLAHDFNNIIAGISGSLEMVSIRLKQGRTTELDRYIDGAMSAAKRAAGLTQRLLAFSRRQTLEPKAIELNDLVGGMLDLINRSMGPEIDVTMVATDGLWTTFVDAGQLENALLNLCINARDAMPDGGKLNVETANHQMNGATARQYGLPAGQYVSLCVVDTGMGMAPEVVERAFEPFFTTKPTGQGTGLGLSMVYGFAGQSGGTVRIRSEVGEGTRVCVYLPRHEGSQAAEEKGPTPDVLALDGAGTVLIVDDEPLIRTVAVEVLQELGYSVVEAADGVTALGVLNSDRHIDLLVTDVGLPGGINGRQVADAARVARPELKVLFITGYAENAVLNHSHLDQGMHILTKPFQMDELAAKVRDLIPQPRDAG